MKKHTPAPWKVSERRIDQEKEFNVYCDAHFTEQEGSFVCQRSTKEDANIIVMAPEMLELLKVLNEEAFNWRVRNKPADELLQHIWARTAEIIAKAEGNLK